MPDYSSIFEEIKSKVPLEDEVEKAGARLIRSGAGRQKCCCPLHQENTPSFMIYKGEDYDTFYCWGCKTGGDVIEFIKALKNCSYEQVIEYFTKNYKLEYSDKEKNLDEIFSNEIEKRKQKNKTIYNYGMSSSRMIKLHLDSCENPAQEFQRISSYLKAIDLSIYEGNLDMVKFHREMLMDYIRDSANAN